jgi:hypothetical protein
MQVAIKAGWRSGSAGWTRRIAGEMVTRGSRGVELSEFRQKKIVQSMLV